MVHKPQRVQIPDSLQGNNAVSFAAVYVMRHADFQMTAEERK